MTSIVLNHMIKLIRSSEFLLNAVSQAFRYRNCTCYWTVNINDFDIVEYNNPHTKPSFESEDNCGFY